MASKDYLAGGVGGTPYDADASERNDKELEGVRGRGRRRRRSRR